MGIIETVMTTALAVSSSYEVSQEAYIRWVQRPTRDGSEDVHAAGNRVSTDGQLTDEEMAAG